MPPVGQIGVQKIRGQLKMKKLIGKLLKTFAPKQCANYFRHAGYAA